MKRLALQVIPLYTFLMRRRRARARATPTPRVTFYWENPPGPRQGGTVVRRIRGQEYERDVGPDDLLDIPEAAAALGNVHPFSVYRAIWRGQLRVVRRGRQVLTPLQAVKAYLARRRGPRPGPKPKGRWYIG